MIRLAIFAGAVLSLVACGQPDAANDRSGEDAVGETPPVSAPIAAQQTLEVDTNAGRQVAGGEEYSFDHAVVDYDRRLVLASEASNPLAVTAYSLDDGSVQHVLGGGPAGDGPGELNRLTAIALGPDGVFAAGSHKVLYWSWSGVLLHQWTPTAPDTERLCALNGRPAVALQEGVAFRGDDGETVAVGGEARTSLHLGAFRSASEVPESAFDDVFNRYWTILVTCAESSAYVLTGLEHSLVEYRYGAEPRVIAMPPELVETVQQTMESLERRNIYRNLFLADDGRLVVTTATPRLVGALLDRKTGCWALLRENPWTSFIGYVGMFGDSVVTAEGSREPVGTRMINGRRVSVFTDDNTHIFVRPVRTVAGEPCS